jgi:hypothetical protein
VLGASKVRHQGISGEISVNVDAHFIHRVTLILDPTTTDEVTYL